MPVQVFWGDLNCKTPLESLKKSEHHQGISYDRVYLSGDRNLIPQNKVRSISITTVKNWQAYVMYMGEIYYISRKWWVYFYVAFIDFCLSYISVKCVP